jgi:hypothetical protein
MKKMKASGWMQQMDVFHMMQPNDLRFKASAVHQTSRLIIV